MGTAIMIILKNGQITVGETDPSILLALLALNSALRSGLSDSLVSAWDAVKAEAANQEFIVDSLLKVGAEFMVSFSD